MSQAELLKTLDELRVLAASNVTSEAVEDKVGQISSYAENLAVDLQDSPRKTALLQLKADTDGTYNNMRKGVFKGIAVSKVDEWIALAKTGGTSPIILILIGGIAIAIVAYFYYRA